MPCLRETCGFPPKIHTKGDRRLPHTGERRRKAAISAAFRKHPASGGRLYLISTDPPASSSWALMESASSRATASLTGLGAPSTRSLASLRPRFVIARTALITWIFLPPAPVRTTSTSACSSPPAPPSPPAAGAPPGAAIATGAAAVMPHSSSIFFFSSTRSRTLIFPSSSNTLSIPVAAITPPPSNPSRKPRLPRFRFPLPPAQPRLPRRALLPARERGLPRPQSPRLEAPPPPVQSPRLPHRPAARCGRRSARAS